MFLLGVRAHLFVLACACVVAACGGTRGDTPARLPTYQVNILPLPDGDTWAAQKTGPIAPGCTQAPCAEVDLAGTLACHDPASDAEFTLATTITGTTERLSCAAVTNAAGALDLRVAIGPARGRTPDAAESEQGGDEVWFTLRDYAGPGTYTLENLGDDTEHVGLALTGTTVGYAEKRLTVGTVACIPKTCEAIVGEDSDAMPADEMSQHAFRVRVEIRCPRGGQIGDMGCTGGATRCTFARTPTLLADLVCRL